MRAAEHPVLDAVRSQKQELQRHADDNASQRSLSSDTVRILRDSGFMRLLQPRRYGGFECDPTVFVDGVMEIAACDGAAGWVAGVVGVHAYHLGLYADEAQQEVWGDDPDTWISSSYTTAGVAERAPGGHRLSGRWSFSSGSETARWVFVGGVVNTPDGPEHRHFLVPRSDYEIKDVWHVAGLSGTGSNDIVIDDAFVPEHRSMTVADLTMHRCPGLEVNEAPLFRVGWGSVFLNAVSAPVVGMARGALDHAVPVVAGRIRDYTGADVSGFDQVTIWPHMALGHLADASSEIDAARLQLLDNMRDIYEAAQRGEPIPLDLRARARRDQVTSVRRAIDALDRVFSAVGGRGLSLKSPIQRLWRDAHAGAHHVVNTPEMALLAYGRYLAGESMIDPMV